MSVMGWIVLLFVFAFVNLFIGHNSIKGFLASHVAINSTQDLEEFKRVARRHMYQALLQIGFLGVAGVLGLYGIISGKLNWGAFLIFILLNVITIAAGKAGKKAEEQARSLKAADSRLAGEYRDICDKWTSKPFPDF